MRLLTILAALAATVPLAQAGAQAGPELIHGRVQAINAEQLTLVTENGTTFIKLTPDATVALATPTPGDQAKSGGATKPGKLSDVELGAEVTALVTRDGQGLPIASRINLDEAGR